MSSRTLGENLHTSARTIGLKPILKLLQNLQKQNPDVDDSALIRWLMYSPLTVVHSEEVIFGLAGLRKDDGATHRDGRGYYNSVHSAVYPYTLGHDENDAAGLAPPPPADRIFGAGVTFDDDGWIAIPDNEAAEIDFPFSIVFWIKLSEENNSVQDVMNWPYAPWPWPVVIRLISGNRIRFRAVNSHSDLTIPNDNEWHHITCVFRANNTQAYLDGVAATAGSQSATLDYSSDPDGGDSIRIGYGGTSSRILSDIVSLAHLTVLKADVSAISNWISDDMDGFRRLADVGSDGRAELLSIPFAAGSLKPEPMARPGFCYPSE